MQSVPLPGSPALRQGLIFGVILAVVQVVIFLLGNFIPLGLLVYLITLVLYLFFGLFAGQRASIVTGRIGTGVLAGLLTGLISSIIGAVIFLIWTIVNVDSIRQLDQQIAKQNHIDFTYTNAVVIQGAVLFLVFIVILASLISLAGGAIGGYRGKRRAQVPPPPEYKESMFQPPSAESPPDQDQNS